MCQFYVDGEQSNYSRYPIRPWTPAGTYIVIFMFYPPCPLTSISLIYAHACRSVPINEVIMHNQALIVTTEKYTNHDTIYYHHPRGRQTELTPSRYSCASFNLCVSVYVKQRASKKPQSHHKLSYQRNPPRDNWPVLSAPNTPNKVLKSFSYYLQ